MKNFTVSFGNCQRKYDEEASELFITPSIDVPGGLYLELDGHSFWLAKEDVAVLRKALGAPAKKKARRGK